MAIPFLIALASANVHCPLRYLHGIELANSQQLRQFVLQLYQQARAAHSLYLALLPSELVIEISSFLCNLTFCSFPTANELSALAPILDLEWSTVSSESAARLRWLSTVKEFEWLEKDRHLFDAWRSFMLSVRGSCSILV